MDSFGRVVFIWEVSTGKELRRWELPFLVHSLAFTADGRHLTIANQDGTFYTCGCNMIENALYKLECVTDDPEFEGFAFIQNESLRGKRRLTFDFDPDDVQTRGRAWTVTPLASLWHPQRVVGNVRPYNDYPCVNLTVPALSKRAVDALRDMLEPNGELLPLVSSLGEYFAYNVTTVADILDHQRSDLAWFSTGPRAVALHIRHYECIPERLSRLFIFRLVEKPAATFVTQLFVDRVRQHGLQGFHFIRLWPLADEAGQHREHSGFQDEKGQKGTL
jgi:hypothetical protein